MSEPLPEVWLRGPVPDVPALLHPVAHALLQAGEEVDRLMADFPDRLLWTRPRGIASVGFHLQHLRGILDRLFTYARGDGLDAGQIANLDSEGVPQDPAQTGADLVSQFNKAVQSAVAELQEVDVTTLTEGRDVGRSHLPSTTLGLYAHAAEHTMRHVGQLLVTVRLQLPSETGNGDA